MKKPYGLIFAASLMTLLPGLAGGQNLPPSPGRGLTNGTTSFPVRTMDFDLWCQQTQRYDAMRCMARRPEDIKAFEDYRGSIERYELDYLRQVQKDQEIRNRTNRDPTQTVTGKQDGVP
jgi:hypothetical protein